MLLGFFKQFHIKIFLLKRDSMNALDLITSRASSSVEVLLFAKFQLAKSEDSALIRHIADLINQVGKQGTDVIVADSRIAKYWTIKSFSYNRNFFIFE